MATAPGQKPRKAPAKPKVATRPRTASARRRREPSMALVPVPKDEERDGLADPRRSDVDEWGRSEHMRELARRVYGPIYRSWFRVEWEGLEKIPTDGGALLVSNHAGAIPSDAPAIMHGIETELGRPVYGLADDIFKTLPVVGTLWSRVGGVLAHPDNAYRLLREQQQLALVFPEGTKGTGKTYGERYQLRRFGRGGFVQIAMRAGVPVVPIAVVGAEESMPILFKINPLAKAARPPRTCRSPPTCSPSARSAGCCLLPGQVQAPRARPGALRRASPTSPATRGAGSWTSPRRIRQQIQEALYDMLRQRRVGLVRLSRDGQARPRHRARHVLGRPGGPGPRGRPHRRRDRRPRPRRAHRRARAHRVRAHRRELLDPRPHREGGADRHDRPHVPRRRLHADAVAHDARDQRHRHHEPLRRRVGAGLARCATSS